MTEITQKNKDRARELVSRMTLDEKIGMIHGAGLFRTQGVPRLSIPPLTMSDGPMGVRRDFHEDSWTAVGDSRDYATYLPCGSAVASTWNPILARETGEVLGREARGRGKDVILAPSINIKRSPLCGRNFEYMSEDPYLVGRQCVPLIEGIQESDVAACAKHFVANSQETDRLQVNEIIGERALRELYLPAFHAAVTRAKTLSVMGAYNLVNGERCCESTTFLGDILRGEWGFDGLTVSDWGGVFRTRESAESELDIEMSVTSDFDDYKFARPLRDAVLAGSIDVGHVDRKVVHILSVMDALHMLDGQTPSVRKAGGHSTLDNRRAALDVAQESVVLLKNDAGLLPLPVRTMTRILVVGANADRIHSSGGGSAEIKALYEVTPLLGLCAELGGNVDVRYVQGYVAQGAGEQSADWQRESLSDTSARARAEDRGLRRRLRDEAVELASQYSHVVFVGGLDHTYDLEGSDRADMKLPYGQDELIEALLSANANTIVTLVAGSPVEMPWAERAHAIVWSWYGGCEAGTALARVLTGRVNPSGHLAETFPMELSDSPAHALGTFGRPTEVEYGEDIYVGYRYYETKHVPVRFCFGHGLSYTTFRYDDLRIERTGDGAVVHCTVTNTGDVAGKAVVQLYLGLEGTGEDRPAKELKGFDKIDLGPSQSASVSMNLHYDEAMAYYSRTAGRYAHARQASLYVGESVQDIRLSATLTVDDATVEKHI
ncbi:MAG: glycoside hydrolase family 3 C-terminal domain-containing protein [Bifidobacterium sp.]|jgi:beta-glucosidase|nr:glycoside hydrolase family 3 C-terminal domain-containing protein [Bifidobacterium sp.]MCI1865071.1 glycoside hydrolase family 3 C-terminal domain-containing protein [Bifidobacterium sp.]